jgi:N-dimethylarginine dimethylaminohydrolase
MADTRATYGGSGWVSRESNLEQEIRSGELWAPLACDSGSNRMTDVLLYRPGAKLAEIEDIDRVLHLRAVDPVRLGQQVDRLIEIYESLGVRVHRLPDERVDDLRHPNSIFLCDVFWQTPFGAVIARMASPVRAGEERTVSARLAELGVPIALTIAGDGLLEGADCHWLRPGLAIVGTGIRTNESGFVQLRDWLAGHGITCLATRFDSVCQHLTGCVQSVAPDRVFVRSEVIPPETIPLLRKSGFHVTSFPESTEIRERYGFNFVVLEPNVLLLPSGCPETRAALEAAGAEVAAEVEVSEYLAMAGGPCCASGVLAREPGPDAP